MLHIWPYWTLCHNNEYYVLLESLQSLQGDGSLQPPQQWQETNFIQRVQVDTSHELEEGRPFLTSSAEKAVKLLVWLHSGLSPDWHTVNCAIVPLWDPLFHIVVSCESPRFYWAAFTVAPQLLCAATVRNLDFTLDHRLTSSQWLEWSHRPVGNSTLRQLCWNHFTVQLYSW